MSRICIEHGGFGTTGDYAMLVNVVRKLREAMPGVTICARRNPEDGDIPVEGVDAHFGGLGPHYRNLWRTFYSGRHKSFPAKLRPAVLNLLVLYATGRLLTASLVARLLRTTAGCPHLARSFLRAVQQCDLFYVAGNGGMTDQFLYGGLYGPCAEIMAARILGKQIIASGQGVGPVKSRLARRFIRGAFRRCALATVRETHSLEFVRRLDIPNGRVLCTGDDAHDIPVDPELRAAARGRLAGLFPTIPRTIAAVNIRWAPHAGTGQDPLQKPMDLCRRLAADIPGIAIVFVPMLSDSRSEVAAYRLMARNLEPTAPARVADCRSLDPAGVKALIGAADLAVGYSYHFAVFALSSCVPAIGVYETDYYRQKLEGVMERYGMSRAAVDLNAPDWQGDFGNAVKDILQRAGEVRRRLRDRYEKIAEETLLPIRHARRLLESAQ